MCTIYSSIKKKKKETEHTPFSFFLVNHFAFALLNHSFFPSPCTLTLQAIHHLEIGKAGRINILNFLRTSYDVTIISRYVVETYIYTLAHINW